MPDGVGVDQFDRNQSQLFQWIQSRSAPNHLVSVTGHSLGGALTQLVAAAYTGMDRELAQVVTFNAPGISAERAAAFVPGNVERVMHYVTNGDPVSLAGDQFIEGKWRRSNFDDLAIVHNHQFPVLTDFTIADDPDTPEIDIRPRSETLTFTEYEDTTWLNDPLYFHTDPDYFFWLAVIQVIVSTTPEFQPLETLPGRLIFRTTTEAARQSVGHFIADNQEEIDQAIAVMTCESTDARVSAPDFDVTLLGLLEIQATDLGAICVAGPPQQLRLQGEVTLPQINNATADFAGDGNYIGLGENGLIKEGRLSIDELPLLPGFWGLQNVFVDIRDTTNELEAGGTLQLPTGITVAGTLGFLESKLNKVSLEVPGPLDPSPINQPLGSTGIFLQGIDGTVDHVSSADMNPISFGGGLDATGGPRVTVSLPSWAGGTLSGQLIELSVNGLLDRNHIDASGTLSIIEGVATVSGNVEVNWNQGYIESSGALNVLDGLITANGSFRADSNLDINTFAEATFGIPDAIPLIGGFDAVSGQFALDYSNDSTSSNDFVAAWTTFDLPLVGETNLGFRVFLDGSFGTIGAEEIAEIVPPGEGEQVASSTNYAIDANTDWALFSAEWGPATARSIVLTTPSGEQIAEQDFASRDDIAIVGDLSGDSRRVVVVNRPVPGEWSVSINDESALTNLRFHAFAHNEIPVVQVQAADGIDGAPVEITFDAVDPDSEARVSLFYDTDNQGFDGVRIVSGLAELDEGYTWVPDSLVEGEYFIYAVIDDGINPIELAYADESIDITPPAKRATVFLPVDGGVFEAFSENGDLVVRRQGGEELFRSPESKLLGVDIVGVANVDDLVQADFSSLNIPVSLDGGHSGNNVLSVIGSGQTIDLTQSVDFSLRHLDRIDIVGDGINQLTVGADEILNLAPESSTLQLQHNEDDRVNYAGAGWEVKPPVFVEGQQRHVVTNGDARVETINTRPYQNPLEVTDVNLSGGTTSVDALLVINFLARSASTPVELLSPTAFSELPERYYDVNGSTTATALDALIVINFIARQFDAETEQTAGLGSVDAMPAVTNLPAKFDRVTTDWETLISINADPKPKVTELGETRIESDAEFHEPQPDNVRSIDEPKPSPWVLAVDQLMKLVL